MTQAKHTPTPWKASQDGTMIYTSGNAPFGFKLVKPSGERLESEIKANATFIVKAVNSHESLVGVVRDLVHARKVGMGKSSIDLRYKLAEEALKQAEAE